MNLKTTKTVTTLQQQQHLKIGEDQRSNELFQANEAVSGSRLNRALVEPSRVNSSHWIAPQTNPSCRTLVARNSTFLSLGFK